MEAKIVSGEGRAHIYQLRKIELSANRENESLRLALTMDDGKKVAYQIEVDPRQPDFAANEAFLRLHKEAAEGGRERLFISEYLERQYIYAGSEEDYRQFTAREIDSTL